MNILLGCGMIVLCLSLQILVVSYLLRGLSILEKKHLLRFSTLSIWTLLITVSLVLLIGNLCQAALWAWLFLALGEYKDFVTALYFSLVNFTTLGYGDLVMSPERRILGALEAANGVLMLGLTTSALYSVVSRIMQKGWRELHDKQASPAQPGNSKESASSG
ncbi:MAG: potassium channel family protein [Desulfobacterales bacterium]